MSVRYLLGLTLCLFVLYSHSAFQVFIGGEIKSIDYNNAPYVVSYSIGSQAFWEFNYLDNTEVIGFDGPVSDMAVFPYMNDTYFFSGNFSSLKVTGSDVNHTLPTLNSVARYNLKTREYFPLNDGLALKEGSSDLFLLSLSGEYLVIYGDSFSVVNVEHETNIVLWLINHERWNVIGNPTCAGEKTAPTQLLRTNETSSFVGLFKNDKGMCIMEYSIISGKWTALDLPENTVDISSILYYNVSGDLVAIGNFDGEPKTKADKFYPCRIYNKIEWTQCSGFVTPIEVSGKLVVDISSVILNSSSLIIGGTFQAKGGANIAYQTITNTSEQFISFSNGVKTASTSDKTVISAISTGPPGLTHYLFVAGNIKGKSYAVGAWININNDNIWKSLNLNSSDVITKMLPIIGKPPHVPDVFPSESQIIISIVVGIVTVLVLIFGCCGISGLPGKD